MRGSGHRHVWEYVLDQPGRRLDHAPRAARRAETTALAAERHQVLMATAGALHPHEAVLEPPAAQVALELRVHERRKRGPLLTQRLVERLEVLFHDTVEHAVLGVSDDNCFDR